MLIRNVQKTTKTQSRYTQIMADFWWIKGFCMGEMWDMGLLQDFECMKCKNRRDCDGFVLALFRMIRGNHAGEMGFTWRYPR